MMIMLNMTMSVMHDHTTISRRLVIVVVGRRVISKCALANRIVRGARL